ncbi:MAG: hypothetical protein M3256_20550 [Actinomycetota bacterium]|nr:hypothetical protein [Actinomycetota bacterium]
MSEVTEKIRSRGYWRLVIRPAEFVPDAVPYESLTDTIRAVQVRMRGWNLPHFREPFAYGGDWVGHESQFHHHLEAWRFFTSGQFADLVAFASDWRDESGLHPPPKDWEPRKETPVWESLFRFTEFFELAARLALRISTSDRIVVRIETHGLRGRSLVVDDPKRANFFEPYVASIEGLPFEDEYSRDELIARARGEAVRAARHLFLRFGWTTVTEELLTENQRELTGDSNE